MALNKLLGVLFLGGALSAALISPAGAGRVGGPIRAPGSASNLRDNDRVDYNISYQGGQQAVFNISSQTNVNRLQVTVEKQGGGAITFFGSGPNSGTIAIGAAGKQMTLSWYPSTTASYKITITNPRGAGPNNIRYWTN